MATRSRRELLEEMLAASPHDTFLRYGVAMELAREGRAADAVARLRSLIADQPNYVPAYFQAAQILLRDAEVANASQLLRDGIAAAQANSDLHAAEEMSALLAQIE
jgi:predicted Zn-dependent protease